MTNIFDDETESFFVVVNDQQVHSIWPQRLPTPSGWTAVHGPDQRGACLAYVERNWTDTVLLPHSKRVS